MNRYGWLIYNGGLTALNNSKYLELNKIYANAAEKLDIELDLIANDSIYACVENNKSTVKSSHSLKNPDFVLFLDKDIRLANHLENMGYRLFNSSQVIENCDNKIRTIQMLAGHNIAMPKTFFSPLYFNGTGIKLPTEDFTLTIEKELLYPLVIKEAFGSFGAQVYLIHNRHELIEKQKELHYIPHIYQQFIKSSEGRDVRIYVVGDKVVASMYRHSETDFRANISNGGLMQAYTPDEAFCEMAVKASKILGADFTGVDLLFGENGEPVLCEVNSNAHVKNIYTCTGIDVAEHILRHILEVISNE